MAATRVELLTYWRGAPLGDDVEALGDFHRNEHVLHSAAGRVGKHRQD